MGRKTAGTEGLERLVRAYGERAFRFAYRLSGDIEESKELVQDAFYRALRGWDGYDDSQPLENWFFTILRRLFLDNQRRQYVRRDTLSLDRPLGCDEQGDGTYLDLAPDQEQAVLERLERKETAEAVRAAFDSLSVEHKSVLTLCDFDGMRYEDIGKALDLPVGTVRSRVSRARQEMRRHLASTVGKDL